MNQKNPRTQGNIGLAAMAKKKKRFSRIGKSGTGSRPGYKAYGMDDPKKIKHNS